MTTGATKIFISHSGQKGRGIADIFRNHLARHEGITIGGSANIACDGGKVAVAEAINGAKWFFFIATKHSCKSPDALVEIEAAVHKKISVISLLDEGVREDDLPAPLRKKKHVHIKGAPDKIYDVISDVVKAKEERSTQPVQIQQKEKPAIAATREQRKKNETAVAGFVAGLIIGALFVLSSRK